MNNLIQKYKFLGKDNNANTGGGTQGGGGKRTGNNNYIF